MEFFRYTALEIFDILLQFIVIDCSCFITCFIAYFIFSHPFQIFCFELHVNKTYFSTNLRNGRDRINYAIQEMLEAVPQIKLPPEMIFQVQTFLVDKFREKYNYALFFEKNKILYLKLLAINFVARYLHNKALFHAVSPLAILLNPF